MSENGKQVLVVDDDPGTVEMIAFHLRKWGFEAQTLTNSFGVITALDRHKADLLIIDHLMPGILGLDLAETIRGEDRFRNLPILLISAKTFSVEERERCLKGEISICPKPFSSYELFEKVCELLKP